MSNPTPEQSAYIESNMKRLPSFTQKGYRRYMDAKTTAQEASLYSLHKSRELMRLMRAAEEGTATVTSGEIAVEVAKEIVSAGGTRYEADARTRAARAYRGIGVVEAARLHALSAIKHAYNGDGTVAPAIILLLELGVEDPIGEAIGTGTKEEEENSDGAVH